MPGVPHCTVVRSAPPLNLCGLRTPRVRTKTRPRLGGSGYPSRDPDITDIISGYFISKCEITQHGGRLISFFAAAGARSSSSAGRGWATQGGCRAALVQASPTTYSDIYRLAIKRIGSTWYG